MILLSRVALLVLPVFLGPSASSRCSGCSGSIGSFIFGGGSPSGSARFPGSFCSNEFTGLFFAKSMKYSLFLLNLYFLRLCGFSDFFSGYFSS